jgi:hypothetical protein
METGGSDDAGSDRPGNARRSRKGDRAETWDAGPRTGENGRSPARWSVAPDKIPPQAATARARRRPPGRGSRASAGDGWGDLVAGRHGSAECGGAGTREQPTSWERAKARLLPGVSGGGAGDVTERPAQLTPPPSFQAGARSRAFTQARWCWSRPLSIAHTS